MSGRSEGNSVFASNGSEFLTRRSDEEKIAAADAWRIVLECNYLWNKSPVFKTQVRKLCRHYGTKRILKLLEETRTNWLDSYRELISQINVPIILLWISKRTPDYEPVIDNTTFSPIQKFFGDFPQFVNGDMVNELAELVDHYAECVTSRGMPQQFVSRFTQEPITLDLGKDRADFKGQVWTENNYYPSPEMHEDAAASLLPFAQQVLAGR